MSMHYNQHSDQLSVNRTCISSIGKSAQQAVPAKIKPLDTGKQLLQLRPKFAARLEAKKTAPVRLPGHTYSSFCPSYASRHSSVAPSGWNGNEAANFHAKQLPVKTPAANVSQNNNLSELFAAKKLAMAKRAIMTSSGSYKNSIGFLSYSDASDESSARSTPTEDQLIWEDSDTYGCNTAYSISSASSGSRIESLQLSSDGNDVSASQAGQAPESRSRFSSDSSSASSYLSCFPIDAPSKWEVDVAWKPFAVGPALVKRQVKRTRGGLRIQRAKESFSKKIKDGSSWIECGFSKESTVIDPSDLLAWTKKETNIDVINEEEREEKEEQENDPLSAIIEGIKCCDIEAEITSYFDKIVGSGVAYAC